MSSDRISSRNIKIFVLCALTSLLLKLLLGFLPYQNYDLATYTRVAEAVAEGKNVYASVNQYNYAPPWSVLLGATRTLVGDGQNFSIALTLIISLFDIGCALLILGMLGIIPAIVFLLNPIALVLSGYHRAFEPLALFFAFIGIYLYQRYESEGRPLRTYFAALGCIGLSLCCKHILIFFPLCLLFRKKPLIHQALLLTIPYGIFVLSFLPWINSESIAGIQKNVLSYRGVFQEGLFPVLAKTIAPDFNFGSTFLVALLFGLGLIAYLTRKWSAIEFLALHLAMMFALSPSVANQYLNIPLLFLCLYWRHPFSLAFFAYSIPFLLTSPDALARLSNMPLKLPWWVFQLLLLQIIVSLRARKESSVVPAAQ